MTQAKLSFFKTQLNCRAFAGRILPTEFKHSVDGSKVSWPLPKGPDFEKIIDSLPPLQQSDLMKPLLLDIGNHGLMHAYKESYHFEEIKEDPDNFKCAKTKHPRKVIIIGAGPAGLAAGYELKRAGHQVTILEMQHRVGGRIKTVKDSHFYPGLWSDAGAMRLPGKGDPDQPSSQASHFMVDFYAQKFELPTIEFINECENGYYKFYGTDRIQMKEWQKQPNKYCSDFWPGWDKQLQEAENLEQIKKIWNTEKVEVNGIDDYFKKSVMPVVRQLYKWIQEDKKRPKKDRDNAWSRWVTKWSSFSVKRFLTSSLEQIRLQLDQHAQLSLDDEDDLEELKYLLPWPIEAFVAYTTFTYIVDLDVSLVELLRDFIGQWWKMPMHSFKDGLEMLPWAFIDQEKNGGVDLSKNVIFGAKAHSIHYTAGTAEVTYYDSASDKDAECIGDAVILTLPVHIIRQLKFEPPLPPDYYAALENISYSPSTKILLQCRRKFWEEDSINGGFSKTNMPIGQLHYPSNPNRDIQRGILMCYTWKDEALLFGSQSPKDAIAEAVREVTQIHPKMKENFEVGAVQAWYSDPTAQGAFALLKPMQYLATEKLIDNPYLSMYFAGEALSTTNGWIQGAIVSGLRAAFQFFHDNEELFIKQE